MTYEQAQKILAAFAEGKRKFGLDVIRAIFATTDQ